jgi:hypothetical protein
MSEIIDQWATQHDDFFDVYGAQHPLSAELARLIIADLCLSGAVKIVYEDFHWDPGRYEITDAINFAASGLELVRSSIFLMYSNYQPAPYFLLRSAVNQFWFSYCAVTNREFTKGRNKGKRFYDVFDAERSFLSGCEIRREELERITGNRLEDVSIVWDFNAILHGDARIQYLWLRSRDQHPASPSPRKLEKEALKSVILPLVAHLRGCQELARITLGSIFLHQDPELIWTSWVNEMAFDDGEAAAQLMTALESSKNRDLDELPRATGIPSLDS